MIRELNGVDDVYFLQSEWPVSFIKGEVRRRATGVEIQLIWPQRIHEPRLIVQSTLSSLYPSSSRGLPGVL